MAALSGAAAGGRSLSLKAGLEAAIAKLGKFRTDALQATGAARGLGDSSKATAGQVAAMADKADKGGGVFSKFRGSLSQVNDATRSLGESTKATGLHVAEAGRNADTGGGLFGKLKDGMSGSSKSMGLLNKVLGESPWMAILGMLTPLIMKFGEMMLHSKTLQKIVKVVWNDIKASIEPVASFIGGVVHVFENVAKGLAKHFGGLAGLAKTLFGAIIAPIKEPLNMIIMMVNLLIDGLNLIHFKIPSWVPHFGGKEFGVHLQHIPTLADGGIVLPRAGGTLALLGEAGQPEAVVPLNRLGTLLRSSPATGPASTGGPGMVIQNYYEAEHGSARRTAEELLFLSKARG